jgi:phosphoribosylformylglycinamidine synthase
MDKMTESELCSIDEAHSIFDDFKPRPFAHVDILSKGKSALEHANTTLGLALSDGEMDYLVDNFTTLKRNPWVSTFIKIALCSLELTYLPSAAA